MKKRKNSSSTTTKKTSRSGKKSSTKTQTSYGYGAKCRTRARTKSNISIAPYRSKFEYNIADHLENSGIEFNYELKKIPYLFPIANAYCNECGSNNAGRKATYTPDFFLVSSGLWIEAKGKWDSKGRTKILSVLESDNELTRDNFRMLFMQNNWITSNKKKKYMDWCIEHGIVSACGKVIPKEWL